MEPIKLFAQLYDIKARRNGDGKIILETGTDSLPAMQQLLGLLALGDINVCVVIVPVAASSLGVLPEIDRNLKLSDKLDVLNSDVEDTAF